MIIHHLLENFTSTPVQNLAAKEVTCNSQEVSGGHTTLSQGVHIRVSGEAQHWEHSSRVENPTLWGGPQLVPHLVYRLYPNRVF